MRAGTPLPGARRPPPIPGAVAETACYPGHALLLWVRSGTAHARLGAAEFHLGTGEGVWIPAEAGGRRAIITEPGTVAFPLMIRATGSAAEPAEPVVFHVPAGWGDWLIQHFNLSVTPLSGEGYEEGDLLDLLRRSGRHGAVPRPDDGGLAPLARPGMPSSPGARAVAEELLRDPALGLTVAQWARRVMSSPRTLRRDFRAGTGLTFERWRLRCRIGAAAELLASGCGVDEVAHRVGFASRSGLTRAFKQQVGSTPHEFGRALAARAADRAPSARADAARRSDRFVGLVRGGSEDVPAPALLPATRTASHDNDVHVLSWVYRGSGYLHIGGRTYERRRGVATWIPAGVEHVTGLRQGSISLPLGEVSTGDLRLTEPLQVQFSPAWDDYLMFCSISARSRLRPEGFDPTHILDLFRDQVAARRALSVPMPTTPRAREVAMHYLRTIGATGSQAPDLGADLHLCFRAETGMTFARWCYAVRMRIARDLLDGGARPSVVSRRVGYTHLSNFSAAFSRFHGLSPREYQQRERTGH